MQKSISKISSDNLKSILNKICQLTEFSYGEIWLPNYENDFLELSSNYYVASDIHQYSLELFYECSQEFVMSKGEGITWTSFLKPEIRVDARCLG